MLSKILIIDKRKELPAKYKKSLDDEQTVVFISRSIKDALNEIQQSEPELIIISDSINDSLSDFCERIRALTYNTRPVIVALSKSADINDRIRVLDSGADDFWSEPVNIEEFKTRIKAHLRREIESNLDNKTLLPNYKIVMKSLKRLINDNSDKSVLLIGVDNLNEYKSVYSDIAGDKLIQAFVAIVKSATETSDFFGQIDGQTFLLITNIHRAEKFAEFKQSKFGQGLAKVGRGTLGAAGAMFGGGVEKNEDGSVNVKGTLKAAGNMILDISKAGIKLGGGDLLRIKATGKKANEAGYLDPGKTFIKDLVGEKAVAGSFKKPLTTKKEKELQEERAASAQQQAASEARSNSEATLKEIQNIANLLSKMK